MGEDVAAMRLNKLHGKSHSYETLGVSKQKQRENSAVEEQQDVLFTLLSW